MAARGLTERVEILEHKVESLRTLPDRATSLESQILRLRTEMHDGFSAIDRRFDIVDRRFDGVDQRFAGIEQRFEKVDGRLDAIDRQLETIDGRFEETHRFMRVLHEEVLTRISLLQEARRSRKR